MKTARRLAVLAAVLCLALAAAARAQDVKSDPIADAKDHANALVAEGRLGKALELLHGINIATLEPGPALELETLIAKIEKQKAERLEADRAKSKDLEKAGKYKEAIAALDPIATYGSADDAAAATAEKKRLADAGAAAEVLAAQKAEADKKARVEGQKKDEARLKQKLETWLTKRRQLHCSTCGGSGKVNCPKCGGEGRIKVLVPSSSSIGTSVRWDPCPNSKCDHGKVSCGACAGKGFNPIALEDVLFECYAPSVRKRIEDECGSGKQFAQALMDRAANGKEGAKELVEHCYEHIGVACEPITGKEHFEVEFDATDATLAICRYKVKYASKEVRVEQTRWRKMDAGDWWIEPPPELRDGASAPAASETKPANAQKPPR